MKNNVYTSKFHLQKANTSLLRGPSIRDNCVVFLWHFMDRHVNSATSPSRAESTFSAPPCSSETPSLVDPSALTLLY